MTVSPLFAVEALQKRYYGVQAVDGIGFEIAAGGVVALIGPNGSGKSTTVDCLTGFQAANGGRWWLDGEELTGAAAHTHALAGLTRTFQNVRAFDYMSLLQNLLIGGQAREGGSWWRAFRGGAEERAAVSAATAQALELLEVVGLAEYANAPAEILSYGQRKLLAIAASIMARPKLVMLDEPVAGVNPTMISRIEAVIERLKGEGVTLLIIEHNMEFVMRTAQRVLVLDAGRLIADGAPDEIRQNSAVLDAYLGRSRDGGADE